MPPGHTIRVGKRRGGPAHTHAPAPAVAAAAAAFPACIPPEPLFVRRAHTARPAHRRGAFSRDGTGPSPVLGTRCKHREHTRPKARARPELPRPRSLKDRAVLQK